MRCLLCNVEVDEKQQFSGFQGPDGRIVEDAVSRLRLQAELRRWKHVTLTAQVGGGSMTLESGHLCPKHELGDATISLRAKRGDKK